MSGYRHLLIILCALFLSASIVSAKVYWLPDFLGDNNDRSNVSEKDTDKDGIVSGNEGSNRGCPNGWLSSSEIGDKICVAKGSYPWIGTCYSDCVCDTSKYLYTSANCSGTKAPSGGECNDGTLHYKECIDACDLVTGKTNCPYGCKTTYAAEGCSRECKECYPDNCHNRTGQTCAYGCETYFSDCSSECQKCYENNCLNRTDNATGLGCDKYWQDCPSKCEVGKTCVPNDCTGYTLSSCPANASCSNCSAECGDSTVYYKLDSCNTGYTQSGNSCLTSSCSSGYATTSSNCGSAFSNGYWALGTSYSGYSGSSKCYKCTRKCNSGYTLSGTTCIEVANDPCDSYTSKSCTYGCKTYYSDCSSKCQTCYSDNCHNRTNQSCANGCKTYYADCPTKCQTCKTDPCNAVTGRTCSYGCKTYYSECPTKCQTCYSDNCLNRTSISCPDGCSSYYEDCPTACQYCCNCDFSGYPFDSCPTKGICGDMTCTCNGKTKYVLTSCQSGYELNLSGTACNKIINGAIKIKYQVAAGGKISISTITAEYGTINWGDGTVTDISTRSHTYSSAGTYTLTIKGNVSVLGPFSLSNASISSFEQLNLESVTKAYNTQYSNKPFAGDCSNATGSIPSLPPYLENGSYMFHGCKKLTGNIPNLPSTLTNGFSMFSFCEGLTGSIPTLPSALTNGGSMFASCKGLTGSIPLLPKGLTNGNSMFNGLTGLTGGIPKLPSSLTSAEFMFSASSGLSGNLNNSNLGNTNITNGQWMFSGTGITGDVPALPSTLTNGSYMFRYCDLNGTIANSKLGNTSLTDATGMFEGCEKLGGRIPGLPSTLKNARSMFKDCSSLIGAIPTLPASLTSADRMFSECKGLIGSINGLGNLQITNGDYMFRNCENLTGSITKLPPNLTSATQMFLSCKGITGNAPTKPSGLTSYNQMFKGSGILNNGSWPSDAW